MDYNKSLTYPVAVVDGTGTNASAVADVAQHSNATMAIFVTKIVLSAAAAPGASVEATLTGPVGGPVHLEIPANAFAPIVIDWGTHPLRCAVATDAVLTLPALGVGVKGAVQVYYYYGPAT